jgi:hypothetical protein
MANSELSRFLHKERIHMPAPTTTQSWSTHSRCRAHPCCLPTSPTASALWTETTFRGSISRPVYAPTDASPPVSRPTTHGLGSIWFARPCIVRDFHSVFFASFSGASGQVVKALSPSASVPRLFLFRSSSRLWELWNRSSIVSTAPAASMFLISRDQRACLKYKYVLGCRLFLVALKIIGATISQRRVETL